ncbi:hypothetical protein SFUMM280S_10057 [Streptomyces fumanus]
MASPVGEVVGVGVGGVPPALPQREVRVLHPGFGQPVGVSRGLRAVERGQVPGQDAHRPAVGDDVVLGEQQDVVTGCPADEQRPGQGSGRQVVGPAQLLGQQARDGAVPPVGRHVPDVGGAQRQVRLGGDALDALSVDRGEGGAQGGVAGGEPVQGAFQGRRVEGAAQAQRHAGVVLGAAVGEVVEEPQAPLGAGERDGLGARGGGDRLRRGGGRLGGQRGERADGPRGEHVAQGEPGAGRLPDAGQHAGREDRVAAQVEEVVVEADGVDAEDVGPDRGQGPFAVRARGDVPFGRRRAGGGQRPEVDLVLRGERQRVQHDDRGGHHVRGQGGGEGGAQPGRLGSAGGVGGGDVADEPAAAGLLVADHDDGLADLRVPGQGGLDLAGFDAEAADLDLPVGAAEELQLAVVAPAHPVAGAVEPGAGRSGGVGDEACRGQSGPVEVAAGQSVAAHVEFALTAGRHRAQRRVQDVGLGAGQGAADGGGTGTRGQGAGPGGDDGGLGRPVGVDHAAAGGPPVDEGGRARLGPDDQGAQRRQAAELRRVGQGGEGGRRYQGVGDAVFGQDGGEFVAQPGPVRRDDQDGAGQHRDEQLQYGGVEARRGELQHPVAGADGVPLGGRRGEPGDAPVGDGDALGGAGGAGGEDDVRGVVGPHPADVRVRVRVRRVRLPAFAVQQRADPGEVVQDDGGYGVGEHQLPSFRRVVGVDGEEGRPGEGHGQLGGDQFDRAWQDQGHGPLRSGAVRGEVGGEPAGLAGEFPVGPGAPAVGDRGGVRVARHLPGEQLTERHVTGGGVSGGRPDGAGRRRRGGALGVQVRHRGAVLRAVAARGPAAPLHGGPWAHRSGAGVLAYGAGAGAGRDRAVPVPRDRTVRVRACGRTVPAGGRPGCTGARQVGVGRAHGSSASSARTVGRRRSRARGTSRGPVFGSSVPGAGGGSAPGRRAVGRCRYGG